MTCQQAAKTTRAEKTIIVIMNGQESTVRRCVGYVQEEVL